MSDLNTEIKIGADASGVEAGVGKAKRSLKDLGDAAQKAGKDAGAGIGSIGAGGDKAAKDVERATKNMQGSLQRLLAEQKAGAKGSREYYEALADTRGISRNAIKPILDQIDAAKNKTLQAKTAADSWTASLGKVAPLVAAAFSGAAITGFLGKVVSVQREFDVLNSSLKTVTGSSAAAEREMAWLKDFAKETPFGLAQATQGFVKMKALGLDPTRAALTSFGNTASAMGKDLNQMIEAVADASTGEFERLKEFGIKAKKEGDNVSLTFQGVTTTIRNSAADITKYLEDIGNTSFGGAMEERAKTLDGTIAALGDTWDELFRTVSTNNVGSLIFDSVTLANGVLEDATTIIRAMGGAVGETSREFGSLSAIQGGVATFFETVSVLAANTLYVLRQTGDTMAGVAAGYKAFFSFDFDAVRAIGAEMKANGEAARKEIDATTARILNARKEQEEYARYATRNASAATDPRRVDLGGSTARATGGGSSGTAKAVKEAISEYDKLIKKLSDELPKAAAEAEAAQMGYNKAQTEFLALAGSDVWAKFSNSERARVASLYEGKIASEQAGDAAKELSKAYAEAAAERIKTIQSMERAADSLQSQNDALREEIELIGLSTEQQTLVLQQRNDVIILTKEATLAELERQSAITGTQTRVEIALASEIEALKERNALLGAKGVKNASVDAAKTAKDEWQKTTDSINQSLTDSLLRGFESGKDFAKNLRDTVVNMFNTMVLRPVISAIVNPVAGAVTSALGLSGAQGGGNSIMGGIQTASNLNTLYGAGSQALFGGAAGASAASLGYANVVGMAGGDAIGALAAANGMWAGVATGAQAAAQAAIASNAAMAAGTAAALPAGTTAAAAGAGAGGASGALAAIPGWGWALAGVAALGMLAKKFDDSGTPHTGAGAIYSEAGGLQEGAGIYNGQNFGMGVAEEYAKGTQEGVSTIAKSLTQTFDGIAKAFGKTAGYEIATAFADDSSKDGAWGSFRISQGGQDLLNWNNDRQSKWAPREFANGEEGYKQYMAEIAKGARTALVSAIGDVSWAKDMLTAIGESASMEQLSATVQQIAAIKTQFVQLGKAMEMFDGISSGMESALLRAAGSIDALTASAAGYYDAVYTEQEKIARARTQLETTLAGYGQSLPATREQYRALVEQQMAAGESGAEFAVVLMGLAGTFAQVADDIDAQFAEIGKSASEVFEKLLADIGRVRGDVAGTRADMLASAQVMTPAQIAAAANAAMVYAPTTAGIVGAHGGVASAASQLASAQQGQNYWSGVVQPLAGGVAQTQQTISALDEWFGGVQKSFDSFTAYRDWAWSGAGTYRESMALIPENKRRTAQYGTDQASYASQRQAAEAQLARQQAALSAASAEAGRYAEQLAAAQAAVAAAQRAEVQARVDYAAQISQFVTAAGGSVSKLSGLREEVVRYYEAQEQAVQSMIATAENLRAVVNGIRMGQLDSAQTASQLGSSYAMDYSMALATTGSTRAGYADSMASALPTLVEAIKAEASTASDWRVQSGKLLAQATGVAGLVDADASGTDYKTTSLGLLDSIDTALAQLEGSTKSAEQVIAQAINDGTASQLTGLRAIVAALRGESVPAFATGGSFGGGIRLVGENGPELEVTGPSRIYSASQTAAMLSGGGNANAELVAELRALRADNQAQAAAMVNMQRELNKLMLHWDSQGMPEERIV